MPKLFFVFALGCMTVRAENISVPMHGSNPKLGDAVTFTEDCDAKKVPVNQDGAKYELTSKTGHIMVGTPWTVVHVSKGYEGYDLMVIHTKDEDPIALIKSGKFQVVGSPAAGGGCTHTRTFKIYSADANPPCNSATENSTGTTVP